MKFLPFLIIVVVCIVVFLRHVAHFLVSTLVRLVIYIVAIFFFFKL